MLQHQMWYCYHGAIDTEQRQCRAVRPSLVTIQNAFFSAIFWGGGPKWILRSVHAEQDRNNFNN